MNYFTIAVWEIGTSQVEKSVTYSNDNDNDKDDNNNEVIIITVNKLKIICASVGKSQSVSECDH